MNGHPTGTLDTVTTLFVAAGGGGDAVGILLSRRLLDDDSDGTALIATCAWERLRIDPLPGPRPLDGFKDLGEVAGRPVEVLETSDTDPPGRSTLPRLAATADARLFLLDFSRAAAGVREQLRFLANATDSDTIVIVDVGGDIVANGGEPELKSPLADSLMLAGALATGLPTRLAVVGPGTDAELSEQDVLERLSALNASAAGKVTTNDVEAATTVLDWHPTEASSLVAASAAGLRGSVEMRRGGPPTPLTGNASRVWLISEPDLDSLPIAKALASTTRLEEARAIVDRLAVDEIAYEEAKASEPVWANSRARDIAQALASGATHVTTRRLLELTAERPENEQDFLERLAATRLRVGGLWPIESLQNANTR